MSTRRLRIKPTANLTSRRAKTDKTFYEKLAVESAVVTYEPDNTNINLVELITNENITATKNNNETVNGVGEIDNVGNIKSLTRLSHPLPLTSATKTKRQRLTPIIARPERKSKLDVKGVRNNRNTSENPTKSIVKITEPGIVGNEGGIQYKQPPGLESVNNLNHHKLSDQITNFKEPIDDSVFKSPQNFLTPLYNPLTPNIKLFGTEISPLMLATNELVPKDELKCPVSPTKIRQRIKVVPMLGNRRASIQGRDECEEIPRRLRDLTSGSSVSSQKLSLNYKTMNSPSYQYSNRLRTESPFSNASDISNVRDRRENRSDEQRLNEVQRGFKERFQNSVPGKSQLKMYDMIFYNPSSNPMKTALTTKKDGPESSSLKRVSSFVGNCDPSISDPTVNVIQAYHSTKGNCSTMKSKSEEDAMPVPQLKIGPKGDIIIDEKSLVIEMSSEKSSRETLASSEVIYDDEFSGTQGFYKRQIRKRDWERSETIKFYRCLQTIGTDFSMMIQLFPKRNRRELKLKFKKEEKNNPGLINKALLFPKAFSIEKLEEDFKRDEEMQRLKDEQFQQELKELKRLKSNKKKRKYHISRTFQCLQNGEFIYENENLLFKNMAKHRRPRNRIYENRNENEIFKERKRFKLSENVSPGKKLITKNNINSNYEFEDDESNNNDNMYTPNLSVLEKNQHRELLRSSEEGNHDSSSSVLTNGNGFTTLVSNNGKSYFSSDITATSSAKQEIDSIEGSAIIIEPIEKNSDDSRIVYTDCTGITETDVHQSNVYKTDMLFNGTNEIRSWFN